MANHGIKVSRKGEDVKAVDIKNLRFNTEKGAFKIFRSNTASFVTDSAGNGGVTIAHDMQYPPGIRVFRKATARWDELSGGAEFPNAYFPVGVANFYVKDDFLHHAIFAYADTNNLYIRSNGGKPNTLMEFRWYILVDQSAAFSDPDNISLVNDYGFKVSKPGKSVLTGKEYEMGFSSKYKIMQYYGVSRKTETLHHDELYASYHDQAPEQITYVDFLHGLGYPPLPMISADVPVMGNVVIELPFILANGVEIFDYAIGYFVDATRIRVYFWRISIYNPFTGGLFESWGGETITIRMNALTENLAGANFP